MSVLSVHIDEAWPTEGISATTKNWHQPVITQSPICCMLSEDAVTTNIKVFGMTLLGLNLPPPVCDTQEKLLQVFICFKTKHILRSRMEIYLFLPINTHVLHILPWFKWKLMPLLIKFIYIFRYFNERVSYIYILIENIFFKCFSWRS